MNCSDGGTPKTYLANLASYASLEPNSNLSGPAVQVNILEAKNRLSQLIKSAQAGEEVVIANRGAPVARPYGAELVKRTCRQGAGIAGQ